MQVLASLYVKHLNLVRSTVVALISKDIRQVERQHVVCARLQLYAYSKLIGPPRVPPYAKNDLFIFVADVELTFPNTVH